MNSTKVKYVIVLIIFVVLFITCKKQSGVQEREANNQDVLLSTPPSTVALVNNHFAAERQYQRLAIGLAVITNRSQTVDRSAFMATLEGLVDSKAPMDVTIIELDQALTSNQVGFNEPSATADFYDAIASKIATYNPSNSIPAWYSDFFFGWQLGGGSSGGSPDLYKTTIDIPEKDYQLLNNHSAQKTLVVPDLGVYPTVGYSFDNTTNALVEVNIVDESVVGDLMDLHSYYIIGLSYEYVEENVKITHDCDNLEGKDVPWEQFDFFCNEKCGENEANSPFDCSIANSKTIYLRHVGFTNDHKNKQSSCHDKEQHYKSALGKYKVAFSSTVLQANKKVETRENVVLKPIILEDVLRKRTKSNGNTAQRGISQWLDAQNKHNNEEPIVAENYCPVRSVLFIGFYEKNTLPTPGTVFVKEGSNDLAKWKVRGMSISSVKGGLNCSFGDEAYYKRIPYNDPNWIPGTIDGENVMIYNTNRTGDDEFNFELYYFVEKKSK